MIFTANGITVVQPDPARDVDFHERGDKEGYSRFDGRIPILWDERSRRLYLGAPNWFHGDVAQHYDIGAGHGLDEGMVAGGPEWGSGHLKWFLPDEPKEHPEIAEALQEAGIRVPNPDLRPVEDFNPFTWHESGTKGYKKWWKTKGPATVSNAYILAEYACLEHMTREECKKFIDDHEDEIRGNPDEFRRRFFHKFDAFC